MSNTENALPEDFDLEPGYACFHPSGEISLAAAASLMMKAIRFCRENGILRLLVDATQLGVLPTPTLADRYWIARDFAREAQRSVIVSFGFQNYLLDAERFGVTVATNLGMRTNAFETRSEALAWLLSQG
jgi:hypothetical protein